MPSGHPGQKVKPAAKSLMPLPESCPAPSWGDRYLGALALLVTALAAAIHEVFDATWTWIPGGLAFVFGFVLPQWRALVPAARTLAAVTLVLGFGLTLTGLITVDVLHRALDQALYFAFFVTMLGILQDTAAQSPLIRRSGVVILSQPPGRRYSVLTLGGVQMGVLLNLGALSLLGTMIAQGVAQSRAKTEARIADIRLRRMTLAMLRGFCTVPLWSPTSISMPIVLMALPGLTWLDLAPYGIALAAVLLMLGWCVDRLSYQRPQAPADNAPWVRPLLPMLVLIAAIPAIGLVVSAVMDLRMISAILISIPVVALIWQTVQHHGAGQPRPVALAARSLVTETLPKLPNFRSEVVIFAASGAVAIILLPLIDIDALGRQIAALGLGEGVVMVIGFLWIFGMSFVGIGPIVTVSLLMGVLPNLPGLHFMPVQLALMALTAWTLSVGMSPLSAAVRITGRAIGQEPATLGMRWNGAYIVMASALLIAILLLSDVVRPL